MWPAMVVPTIGKFFNGTFELFFCMVAMQFYKLIFQGIIITFHWGVIVWVTSLTHALLDSLRCTEINKLLRCVLAALITMQVDWLKKKSEEMLGPDYESKFTPKPFDD